MSIAFNNFLQVFAAEIDRLTNQVVFDGYQALALLLAAPLASLIVLYFVLMGYVMIRGIIEVPYQEFFKGMVRIGLIYLLGMNWSFFAAHIRDFFIGGSELIATTLMQAIHKGGYGSSINQGLQTVLNEVSSLGCQLLAEGSFRKVAPIFAGLMVFFSGTITVGFAFIEIIITKLTDRIQLFHCLHQQQNHQQENY